MVAEVLNICNPRRQDFPLTGLVLEVEKITREVFAATANNEHAVGAAAAPYLRLVGHLVLAWMWARVAEVALGKLGSEDPIYAAKLATARFYYQRQLPETLALSAEIRAGAAVVMTTPVESL